MAPQGKKLTLFVSVSIEGSELCSLGCLRTPRGAEKAGCESGALKGGMFCCESPDASIIAKLIWVPKVTVPAVKWEKKKSKVKAFLQQMTTNKVNEKYKRSKKSYKLIFWFIERGFCVLTENICMIAILPRIKLLWPPSVTSPSPIFSARCWCCLFLLA